jgi:nicotinate-nucleotide adenylyltransferase
VERPPVSVAGPGAGAGARPRVGMMGGTFDPIHLGHLAIADDVGDALALDRILFVPAGVPPHKPVAEVTSVEHRVAMVALAIADNPAFQLSRIEVDRPGPSFTVDTVEELARDHDVTVILSAETFHELPSWRAPERLFAAARVAVVPREGYAAPDPAWLSRAFPGREDRVTYVEAPHLGVSSTGIRARIATGRTVHYLVPPAVAAYIAEHGLYRAG